MILISSLGSNSFLILRSIHTVSDIHRRGGGCECIIYAQIVLINICVGNKFSCGRDERILSEVRRVRRF